MDAVQKTIKQFDNIVDAIIKGTEDKWLAWKSEEFINGIYKFSTINLCGGVKIVVVFRDGICAVNIHLGNRSMQFTEDEEAWFGFYKIEGDTLLKLKKLIEGHLMKSDFDSSICLTERELLVDDIHKLL